MAAAFSCDLFSGWVEYAAGEQEEDDEGDDEGDDINMFEIFFAMTDDDHFGFDAGEVEDALRSLINDKDGEPLVEALSGIREIEI